MDKIFHILLLEDTAQDTIDVHITHCVYVYSTEYTKHSLLSTLIDLKQFYCCYIKVIKRLQIAGNVPDNMFPLLRKEQGTVMYSSIFRILESGSHEREPDVNAKIHRWHICRISTPTKTLLREKSYQSEPPAWSIISSQHCQQHISSSSQLALQLCNLCPRASCGGRDGEQNDRPSDTPLIWAPTTEGYQEVTAAARGETS